MSIGDFVDESACAAREGLPSISYRILYADGLLLVIRKVFGISSARKSSCCKCDASEIPQKDGKMSETSMRVAT
jgi:hypothetical protein